MKIKFNAIPSHESLKLVHDKFAELAERIGAAIHIGARVSSVKEIK